MKKTSDTPLTSSVGEPSPEFVPVADLALLDLADVQSAAVAPADDFAIGDLLSDALFGEVIDISDLIPRLSPEGGVDVPAKAMNITAAAGAGVADGGDLPAASGYAATLTIFYDDDLLASVSEIL